MARWGMVIDLAKCTGCQACVVACQTENNIPCVSPEEAKRGRTMAWINILPELEGEYPRVTMRQTPLPCVHCEHAPCTVVCPVSATGVGPEGIVRQTYARCIGCRYCTAACPYTRRVFNWSKPEFQGDFSESLSPDVSVRPKGVVEKCTFCHHRLIKAREQVWAEEQNLNEGEYLPACVEVCPANAMYFGDLNDPASTVSELARSPRAYHLLEELGTEPKVTYLSRGE